MEITTVFCNNCFGISSLTFKQMKKRIGFELKSKKMKKSMCFRTYGLLFFLFTGLTVVAQKSKLETENGMLTAIAAYDAEIRKDILTVSQYSAVLDDIKNLREKDQATFKNLIGGFEQKKQGWFYEMTRFPDLLHNLANQKKGLSRSDVAAMLPTKDSNLEEATWQLYRSNSYDLVEVDRLNQKAGESFENLIQNLEPNAKSAFRNLSKYPDVMVFLINNKELVGRIGNLYKDDFDSLNQKLAVKHDSITLENDRQMALYKKQLEEDPEALKELNEASEEYANENGYVLPQNRNYYNNNYYINPYSFWFGYPYWYGSPLWYPGAYWNSYGFSYGLGGFGFYAYPSWGFSNWFYNRGYYRHYPSLYRRFGHYYNNNYGRGRNYYSSNRGFMIAANRHYGSRGSENNRNGRNNSSYSRGSESFRNSRNSNSYSRGSGIADSNRGDRSSRSSGNYSGGRGSYNSRDNSSSSRGSNNLFGNRNSNSSSSSRGSNGGYSGGRSGSYGNGGSSNRSSGGGNYSGGRSGGSFGSSSRSSGGSSGGRSSSSSSRGSSGGGSRGGSGSGGGSRR